MLREYGDVPSVIDWPYLRSCGPDAGMLCLPSSRWLSSITPTRFQALVSPWASWSATLSTTRTWFWCFFSLLPWLQSIMMRAGSDAFSSAAAAFSTCSLA